MHKVSWKHEEDAIFTLPGGLGRMEVEFFEDGLTL